MISDRPGVRALDRAAAAGIATEVVAWNGDRDACTNDVCALAEKAGAGALVLAGFMRVLAPDACARFPNRILNVHPSLLPAFPGAHAVAQALEAGATTTGVTVHFVDEEVDHGPIIAQVPVPVRAGDTVAELHGRIQAEEHRLYPEVVAAFARGEVRIDGAGVVWERP